MSKKKSKKPKLYGMQKYWPYLSEENARIEREKLFTKQDGKCGLCEKLESYFKHKLNVDHNHKTGQVRGLLCYRCNKYVIGRLDYITACKIVKYLSIENQTNTFDTGKTITFNV